MSIITLYSAQSVSTRTDLNTHQRPAAFSVPWERSLL